MIEAFVSLLTNLVLTVIRDSGYLGVFLLMLAESALIPIPSEIIMPFSGLLVLQGRFVFWLVVLAGASGNLVGSLLAYWLGWWGEETFIRDLIKRRGKWLLLSVEEFDRASHWFARFGGPVVLVSRVLPVIRTFISLPAGIAVYPLKKFVPLTFFGSFIWSALLVWLGVKLGDNWEKIGPIFRKFDILIVGVGIILLFLYVYRKVKR